MSDTTDRKQIIKTLTEMIADADVVMLTTVLADGTLRSRPMVRAKTEFDGDLWFFTDQESGKVDDITGDSHVNVAYANPDQRRYISISGAAVIVDDPKKKELFWDDEFQHWLPQGPDDPHVSLLKVTVDVAEYWDAPSSVMRKIGGLVRGVFSGQRQPTDENETIDLSVSEPQS